MARRPLDTGPLSDGDIEPPRDYAPRTLNVRSMNSTKDWTSVAAIVITALLQFGGFIWFMSKLDDRVSVLEKHDVARENQTSDIAVMKSQIGHIEAWVDRQEQRHEPSR